MLDNQVTVCFIDTNVWLYALIESDDPNKSNAARTLVKKSEPIISTQVINEVCVNLLRKANFGEAQISQLVESFYENYTVIDTNKPVLLDASRLRQQYSLSFWDSIIIASAMRAGSSILYSEDMQHGLFIRDRLRVVNPFVP